MQPTKRSDQNPKVKRRVGRCWSLAVRAGRHRVEARVEKRACWTRFPSQRHLTHRHGCGTRLVRMSVTARGVPPFPRRTVPLDFLEPSVGSHPCSLLLPPVCSSSSPESESESGRDAPDYSGNLKHWPLCSVPVRSSIRCPARSPDECPRLSTFYIHRAGGGRTR